MGGLGALVLFVHCAAPTGPKPSRKSAGAQRPAASPTRAKESRLDTSSPATAGAAARPDAPGAGAPSAGPARAEEPKVDTSPIRLRTNAQRSLPEDLERLASQPYDSGDRAGTVATGGGRTKTRQLFSFEDSATYEIDGKPIPYLMKHASELDIVYVRDNCVTDGIWCARVTVPAGASWGTMELHGDAVKNWSAYDYFAFDVFTDDEHPYRIVFELWDGKSRNYQTRCSFEGATTRKGRQTLMWPITRCKRNNKEGRAWHELEPQDKIAMDGLKFVKIFTTPRKDRPFQFWIDNIRLMQEDAAKPKMNVTLPSCVAAAFDFGSPGAVVPGFAPAGPDRAYARGGHGFARADGLVQGGKGWPDLLAGTFVRAGRDASFTFRADVPNGTYRYWLCAGPVIDSQRAPARYRLAIGDRTITDARPSYGEYDGEGYLYRFLWTQYSRRPHALWLDYIDRMYPVHEGTVEVRGGRVDVEATNHFLSALVLVPEKDAKDFQRMGAKLMKTRLAAFERATFVPEPPEPAALGGEYALFVPPSWQSVGPNSAPGDGAATSLSLAGARGQNVFARVAVAPAKDLGACELRLADLAGDAGAIPASAIAPHFVNYRYGPRGVGEMILLPSASLRMEKGLTQCFWLWLTVPGDAKPGRYAATFTFRSERSAPTRIPVELEVYPFELEKLLPVSYGMYYGGRRGAGPGGDAQWNLVRDQMKWMRKIGFTSVFLLGGARVRDVDVGSGRVSMSFDATGIDVGRDAGFFTHPKHVLVTSQLGSARAIARKLPAIRGPVVDQQPGIELRQPEFKKCYMNMIRQYEKFLDDAGVPYAMEIVDEPRETPNPWNRNLEDTCRYGDWMAEAGVTNRFVTPMGDGSGGKDYTKLVDHADIISIHATSGSRRMMERTKRAGKTLWFYNTGMDRLVWGAYPWARGATGRFEWHWCWYEGSASGGYPGSEWYNPFTAPGGFACNAPASLHPGGFLYKTNLLTAADGITDYAYIHTLELRLGEGLADKAVGDRATALLEEIRAGTPPWPRGGDAAAARRKLDEWRRRAAGILKEFAR